MARFERAPARRGRDNFKGNASRSTPRTWSESRGSFKDSRRSPNRFGNDRGRSQGTRVTCAACGSQCEVPFRPTSDKPVYCRDCYRKDDHKSNDRSFSKPHSGKKTESVSDKNFEILNEKLEKIMQVLGIDQA